MGFVQVETCIIDGMVILKPQVFKDNRGCFVETYTKRDLVAIGVTKDFVQDNLSRSKKGVIRGLHFQINSPQGKLIHIIRGKIYDIVVDLRRNSSSFGQWYGIELSEDGISQIYIPEGVAHGFLTLSEEAEMLYKVTTYYSPSDEAGLAWNDPDLGIIWPGIEGKWMGSADPSSYRMLDGSPLILSEKDKAQPTFAELYSDIILSSFRQQSNE